jgi:hypothetical protein
MEELQQNALLYTATCGSLHNTAFWELLLLFHLFHHGKQMHKLKEINSIFTHTESSLLSPLG